MRGSRVHLETSKPWLSAELIAEANLDQIQRLFAGICVYPLMFVILAFSTAFRVEHPVLFWSSAGIILASAAMRLVLLRFGNSLAAQTQLLLRLLTLNVCMTSGVSGCVYLAALRFYGFESWPFAVTMQWLVGIASGSTISFTPTSKLLRLHIVLLLGPALGAGIFMGGVKGSTFAFSTLLLAAFLIVQGHQLHRKYWEQIHDRAQKDSKTRELEQAQREAEAARLAADAANQAKGEFLAKMSHEIRTPMNGVIAMTEVALSTELSEEQRDYLTTVQTSAEALLAVINDILDFSKIEAGKFELDSSPFDLGEMLHVVLRMMAVPAHQKGLELVFENRIELPGRLIGDAGRLRQVFVNLLGNAVKFTDSGEVCLTIVEENRSAQRTTVHFSVSDTGIGISPEWIERIYEAFVQAESSASRRSAGTGLGLAISSRLVSLMGGRLWVDSRVGEGSTFHFTAEFGTVVDVEERAPSPPPAVLNALPVLVVDDNATNRRVLDEMLARWQMRPTLAHSSMQALDIMRQHASAGDRFALVFVDSQMPGMDGFTLSRQIGEDRTLACPNIMMVSSLEIGSIAPELRETGAYVVRPVTRKSLLKVILRALGERREPSATCHATMTPVAARPLQILLAEDNPINQKVALCLLEKQGHSVVIASTGAEAVENHGQNPFDMILMDGQMPVMDGYDATRAIRDKEAGTGRHVPIVGLTAHALKGDREFCLQAGMDDYLSKPIHPRDLYEMLARWSIPSVLADRVEPASTQS